MSSFKTNPPNLGRPIDPVRVLDKRPLQASREGYRRFWRTLARLVGVMLVILAPAFAVGLVLYYFIMAEE
jgi:hypothetical protein